MDSDTGPTDCYFRNYLGVAAINFVPQSCTAFSAQVFGGALNAGLKRSGIEPGKHALLFDSNFLVWLCPVDQVKEGLRAVHQTIGELGLLRICLVEIAFYDQAEGYWRSLYPTGAAPFDRFLAPELLLASKERWSQYGDLIKLLKSVAEQQTGE
jgi:hypothetical protein